MDGAAPEAGEAPSGFTWNIAVNPIFQAGQKVWTPRHLVAELERWRENLQRWDARYLDAEGKQGQPVLLDPRQCTPT